MRCYCQQEYDVDQACHVLIVGGDHTEQLIKTLEESQSILLDFKPYFPTIQIAIKKLLGIDFGTPAYDPFILVLAPIYVKVSKSEIEVDRILLGLNATLDVYIEHIKVFLYGYDDSGEQTEWGEKITSFERIDSSENFLPVKVNFDDKSTYVKIMLYYRDDSLEDFFVKRTESIHHIQQTLEEMQEMPENISAKKERIRIQFNLAKNHPTGNPTEINAKGRLLEQVISQIISLVRDLHVVGTRIDDGIQEIDIYVRNHNKKYVWADLEGMIFIECKNWADRVRSNEIMVFGQKLENKGLSSGVLVAMNGITGEYFDGAKGQLRNFFGATS